MKYLSILFSTAIKTTFMFVVYFFSGFVAKNNKRWGFGSLAGKEFRGNAKYLYNYVRNNCKEIEIFWISKSKSEHEKLSKNGINSVYAYSIDGFIKISTSAVIFCTHGFADTVLCLTRNSILVQLGHMTFTIKNNSRKEILKKRSFFKRVYDQCLSFYLSMRDMDYGIYSSEASEKNLKYPDKWYPKKPLALGLPKSDYLYSLNKMSKVDSKSEKKILGKTIPKNEKLILFLPTQREDRSFHIFNFGFSTKKISNFVEKNNCHFYISYHPTSEHENKNTYNLKNFNLIDFDGNTIDHVLNASDLLVTDYSSIFADYLIFDKPIIFAKFDHLTYLNDRGIKINYEDLPGPKVSDWDELLEETNKILYEKDLFVDIRNNWKNKIYKNLDGNNCKRIAEYFKSHGRNQ